MALWSQPPPWPGVAESHRLITWCLVGWQQEAPESTSVLRLRFLPTTLSPVGTVKDFWGTTHVGQHTAGLRIFRMDVNI